MNQIATIPKRITGQGELVVLSRREYDALVRISREAIAKKELDRELAISLAEYRAGDGYGPFDTAEKAVMFLKAHRRAK